MISNKIKGITRTNFSFTLRYVIFCMIVNAPAVKYGSYTIKAYSGWYMLWFIPLVCSMLVWQLKHTKSIVEFSIISDIRAMVYLNIAIPFAPSLQSVFRKYTTTDAVELIQFITNFAGILLFLGFEVSLILIGADEFNLVRPIVTFITLIPASEILRILIFEEISHFSLLHTDTNPMH